jgi:RNA exonuclease 1
VTDLTITDNENQQRKRQKLDNESPTSALVSQSVGKVKTRCHKGSAVQSSRAAQTFFAPDRAISPPPLRRNLQNGTSVPRSESRSQDSGYTPLKPQSPKAKYTPKAMFKSAKVETLNPRLLKTQAPASHDIRYKLLKALYDHFVRLNSELANDANDEEEQLILSEQELIKKALDIEEEAAFSPPIYSNLVKNKILAYKRMTVQQWKDERAKEFATTTAASTLSLSDTLTSKPVQVPKHIDTGLSPDEEIRLLPRLYTSTTGLTKHGYVNTVPSNEEIEQASKGVEAAKGWELCDRCRSRFQVFPGRREEDGALTSGGPCTYHFGKPYLKERSALDPKAKREKRYRCCNQSMGDSAGCTEADSHVFKISEVKRMAAVLNFVKTPDNPEKTSAKPVCIDGEMGYTVFGLELIRLTATSWPNGEELFDVLVRPIGEILDLNSRFSGVWPKHMAEALPWKAPPDIRIALSGTSRSLHIIESPAAARSLLFSHISPQTPIIGHGLENDLNATRIIHPTIIDTALLFPHKAGLPYRNGLKMLMHTHLNRQIQVVVDGKMDGHDSKEDANAAGELVRFAVGNEWTKMKREGWTLKNGEFIEALVKKPPPSGLRGWKAENSVDHETGRKRSRDKLEIEDGEIDE